MQTDWPLRERMMHNLEQAIDRLNEDFERVEFWAAAMDAFLKPVPDYEAAQSEFLLPRKE
jgi:hypothetical protein